MRFSTSSFGLLLLALLLTSGWASAQALPPASQPSQRAAPPTRAVSAPVIRPDSTPLDKDAMAELETPAAAPPPLRCATITGRIVDEKNEPMVGATVMLKGSYANIYITNSQGFYVLKAPVTANSILFISSAGYRDKEIGILDCTPLTVNLDPLPGTRIKQNGKQEGKILKVGKDPAEQSPESGPEQSQGTAGSLP